MLGEGERITAYFYQQTPAILLVGVSYGGESSLREVTEGLENKRINHPFPIDEIYVHQRASAPASVWVRSGTRVIRVAELNPNMVELETKTVVTVVGGDIEDSVFYELNNFLIISCVMCDTNTCWLTMDYLPTLPFSYTIGTELSNSRFRRNRLADRAVPFMITFDPCGDSFAASPPTPPPSPPPIETPQVVLLFSSRFSQFSGQQSQPPALKDPIVAYLDNTLFMTYGSLSRAWYLPLTSNFSISAQNLTKPVVSKYSTCSMDGTTYKYGGYLPNSGVVVNELWAINSTFVTGVKLNINSLRYESFGFTQKITFFIIVHGTLLSCGAQRITY